MKFSVLRGCAWLLAFWFFITEGYAGSADRSFIRVPNNPASNAITALVQDRDGFLWVGTEKGLVRYDGIEYKAFRSESYDSVQLINTYIRSLYLDSEGILWIGTNEGAALYSPESGRFHKLDPIPSNLSVKAFMELPGGDILLGTNRSLLVANRKGEVRNFFPEQAHERATENISYMATDLYGNIWLANNNGFARLDHPENTAAEMATSLSLTFYPQKLILGHFSIDHLNYMWYCDGETIKRTKATVRESLEPVENIRHEFDTRAMYHDQNERMTIINHRYSGIYFLYYDQAGKIISTRHTRINPLSHNPMSDNVSSIIRDKEGNFWFGTRDGLFFYDAAALENFRTVTERKGSPTGLSHNVISDVLEDSRGDIWVGTSDGLNKLFFRDGQPYVEQFSDEHDVKSSTLNNRVQALAEGDDGILWVGSKIGISYFDPKRNLFFSRPQTEEFLSRNNAMFVRTIFKDSSDRIWIGFIYGGLICYDPTSGQFRKITTPANDFNKADVWTVVEDVDGSIWFGTKREGLFRFDPELNPLDAPIRHMEQYNVTGRKSNQVSTDWITTLFLDSRQNLWVGTSRGLYRHERETEEFRRIILSYPTEELYICGINRDLQGNYWISTTTGVYRYHDQNNSSTFFEFNQGDFARIEYTFGNCLTSDGTMILGGINGLVWFDPSRIAVDTGQNNRVFITDFRIGNREIVPDGTHLQNNINTDNRIVMRYPENQFTFAFSSLHLTNPQYIRYGYMLEGVDQDWIYTGWNRNYAGYTNLSPGKYRLLLRSSNETGNWLDNIRTVELRILPPWYMTGWFYSLLAVAGLSILYTVLRFLYSRNRYRQTERINAIKQAHFINVTHGFKTPLMLLRTPLHQLIHHADQMSDDERSLMLNLMDKNVKRMSNLIKQVIEFRKIDQNKSTLQLVEMNLIPFLEEITRSFETLFSGKNIELGFESNIPMTRVTVDPEKIENVLFNLLSNAYRFTPEGGKVTVKCLLEPADYTLYISVSDTGIGIEQQDLEKVFELFWQADNTEGSLYSNGAGIGLSLSKEIVELHRGKITVESVPGVGSTFTFSLLLGRKHFEKQYVEKETEPVRPLFTRAYIEAEQEALYAFDNSGRTDLPLVYILSDSPDMLQLLRFVLREYRVTTFDSLDVLKEAVSQEHPKLIICDHAIHNNPPMLAFCKEIKSETKTNHIPIMIFTPEDSKEENIIGYEAGVDTIIEKPFGTDYLMARIKQLIRSRVELKEKLELDMILTPSAPEQEQTGDRKFINQVMEVIEKNMSNEDFSLQDFAREMHSSKSVLHTRLHGLTQQSPIEFLRTMRLKKAAQLLVLNAYNIMQVSYMVGFSDSRYFSTCFKKQFGMTPREYIKKYKQEDNIEDRIENI